MGTAVVPINSELKRKKWMREGLIQAASKSFWSPYTGTTKDSVVMQANDSSANSGHTVVFDFDGNLSGKARKGKETAYGTGETKRKFSDKVTVERYRLVVNNGDSFDGVDIGDLSITQHQDSRAKLGDLFIRFKDQSIFDASQGLLNTNDDNVQAATHGFDLGTTFTYNTLVDIETNLRISKFNFGEIRRPLKPYMLKNGEPVWLMIIDPQMAATLRKDTAGYQNILAQADVRGADNRLIKGVIGRIGSLLLVQADLFFGYTEGSTLGWGLNDSEIEMSGLRQWQGATADTALWTGQVGFDPTDLSNLHSRGLILGAGGVQTAFGKMPDYKYEESKDFGIDSESCVEFWMESRKTVLKPENEDYKQAKVANIDYGVITVDLGYA